MTKLNSLPISKSTNLNPNSCTHFRTGVLSSEPALNIFGPVLKWDSKWIFLLFILMLGGLKFLLLMFMNFHWKLPWHRLVCFKGRVIYLLSVTDLNILSSEPAHLLISESNLQHVQGITWTRQSTRHLEGGKCVTCAGPQIITSPVVRDDYIFG